MARPIEATPTIKAKEARELIREIESSKRLSPKKEKELEKCHSLYVKFSNQKRSFVSGA